MRNGVLHVCLTITILSVALLVAHAPGQAQLIDGSKSPESIPDSEAYLLLFLVVRTAPPPHWDFETKVNYLKPSGLTREEVTALITAADEYFTKVQPVDAEIKKINDANRGRNDAPDVLRQVDPLHEWKSQILRDVLVNLHNSLLSKGVLKLQDHLLRVKRGTKMWMPNTQVPTKPKPEHHGAGQEMAR